jgi:hypothetical protein
LTVTSTPVGVDFTTTVARLSEAVGGSGEVACGDTTRGGPSLLLLAGLEFEARRVQVCVPVDVGPDLCSFGDDDFLPVYKGEERRCGPHDETRRHFRPLHAAGRAFALASSYGAQRGLLTVGQPHRINVHVQLSAASHAAFGHGLSYRAPSEAALRIHNHIAYSDFFQGFEIHPVVNMTIRGKDRSR